MTVAVEASDGTWRIDLDEVGIDGPWEAKVRHLARFDEVFGREILTAFCRCFVHVDRLNSLISCMHTSEQYHGGKSVAYARDLNTLVWFTVGTLHELGLAIGDLHGALKKCERLDPQSPPWVTLRGLTKRWKKDVYPRMRNQVAFHVDEQVIERGLNHLVEDEEDVTLIEGDSPKHVDSRLTLGFLAQHNGLDLDLDGYRAFLEVVVEDHGAAGEAIQKAFLSAARAVS